MVVAEVSVVPLGVGTSTSSVVAEAVRSLEGMSGVRWKLHAMGTVVEGPLEAVWEAARRMHEAAFRAGARRVLTTLRLDDRRDKEATMESKVRAVEERLAS